MSVKDYIDRISFAQLMRQSTFPTWDAESCHTFIDTIPEINWWREHLGLTFAQLAAVTGVRYPRLYGANKMTEEDYQRVLAYLNSIHQGEERLALLDHDIAIYSGLIEANRGVMEYRDLTEKEQAQDTKARATLEVLYIAREPLYHSPPDPEPEPLPEPVVVATDLQQKQTCLRCGVTWMPRVASPVLCPRCRSPYWNRPRRNAARA